MLISRARSLSAKIREVSFAVGRSEDANARPLHGLNITMKQELSLMNKFNAQKIIVDGMTFDSKKEALRYEELKLLQRAGAITDLQRQVKFEIIPKCKKLDGTMSRARSYIADFVYKDRGMMVVEDVKGYKGGATYELFKIKKDLMRWVHGIEVREI